MVFKGRFFSSKKYSDSSSPDGSNSPKTPTSASTSDSPFARSDKKKVKSDSSPFRRSLAKQKDKEKEKEKEKLKEKEKAKEKEKLKEKEKEDWRRKEGFGSPSKPSFPSSAPAKLRKGGAGTEGAKEGGSAKLSPILASSLGLNRIKTRSGPLPQETGHRMSSLGGSSLGRDCSAAASSSSSSLWASTSAGRSSGKKKDARGLEKVPEAHASSWGAGRGRGRDRGKEWSASPKTSLGKQVGSADSPASAQSGNSRNHSEGAKGSAGSISEAEVTPYDACDTPKESESPRFKAIMQATSAPRKKFPADIKSFSHELNSKGVRPFPFWKPRGLYNSKDVLKDIQVKFEKAKEEVNSDLAVFAGDLVGIMEKHADTHPEWQEILEDLLLLARSCDVMTPGEFWLQCEGIVQDLDDRRQELPMGVLKKLHTRMLFILTRCTRLLQFHKESVFAEDELMDLRDLRSADKPIPAGPGRDGKNVVITRASSEATSSRKSYSQEQHSLRWKRSQEIKPVSFFSELDTDIAKEDSPSSRERMASWKPFPSPAVKNQKESSPMKDEPSKDISSETLNREENSDAEQIVVKQSELGYPVDSVMHSSDPSKHQHKVSWGNWIDQQNISEEGSIMCRICEEYVPTLYVEDHSSVCAVADRCDQKGLSVDERLIRIAETLEKVIEFCSTKNLPNAAGSPDGAKVSISVVTEEPDVPSPKLSDWSRRGSADMLDSLQETENPVCVDDLKNLPTMTCKTRFGQKSDQGMATSSAGSMTPRSPLVTPRTSHFDMLLAGKGALSEIEDLPQIVELADIARCIANAAVDDERSLSYLISCLEDLQEVVNRRKLDALTVQTFGTRIEKLHQEKCVQLCGAVDVEKVDATSNAMDEEEDVVRSLRTSPVHPITNDRTTIDDFEIIKPISRGAFGRVFLAKKRKTGDLFAIKVLRKADTIRKNAVESILAERDILISVRNPFVVRFFYSFTSRENLYLVMEYLNGGDLYSLLRNLGCLDEEVARVYIAEVVLALEYLHSLRVVHRDLKPDNLLIAHDGHIKLTDFGLSKVGLINSTDDLSGPAVSGTSLLGEDEPQVSVSEHLNQRKRRKKRSAVGTPDYLAPEILLGTGHGTSADWWSVGVILFELIVGIPPFNAEHPQTIFDNILNRKIPWPGVPEEMSFEAFDLIDRLLTEDPHQRLGARGASEVKQHVFFKNISWDTLARQKAAFVPAFDSAHDTSYFTSRYSWNPSDEFINEASEYEDSSDNGSISGGSSCISNRHEEPGDPCDGLTGIDSDTSVNYSFSNFSFKNLSQLASINYDLLSKGWKEDVPPKSNS
ncbi:putative serine/threonine protein kinase IREH1 [Iris pallida]|uniref:non-specific serine/threonine protein kinase n=1 Tax=Iris pallida TaxID=29817 RepID=A0AAX6I0L2_IRIPA|nr:putative serine/threonine protein kinase IREH1 [Iris pallida]